MHQSVRGGKDAGFGSTKGGFCEFGEGTHVGLEVLHDARDADEAHDLCFVQIKLATRESLKHPTF